MAGESILIVDDEAPMRRLLRRCLEAEGFRTCEAEGAAAALRHVEGAGVDLVTLDIGLGRDDGFDLAREIRRVSEVPIVMVTGRGDVIDRVVGLELGADDYIAKPFHAREVAARVRSVLRRTATRTRPARGDAPAALRFDGLTARLDAFELRGRDGERLDLTAADFRLLRAFLESPKRVLSRERLMDLVGGPAYAPYDRTVDNQVARLRRKIERDPADPRLVVTVRGVGYSFTADVEEG
jgi:DNA-binding response OmpR family regulator